MNSFWREVRCWSPTLTDSTFSNPLITSEVHLPNLGQQVRLGNSVGPTLRWASSTLLFEGNSVWEAKAHGKRKHPYFHNPL
ncbi:hypothetical protein LXL04_023205 [Taraxacum kok-saghyz]